MSKRYYYCPDYKEYVMLQDGNFSSIKNGEIVDDNFYKPILIGEIWADEITEEEFNEQLLKSN